MAVDVLAPCIARPLHARCCHDFSYNIRKTQFVKHACAETVTFQYNWDNTMAADVLAPCIARPSALSSHSID